jgi:hypothetical protein
MLDQYLWDVITSTGSRQGTVEVSPETGRRILEDAAVHFVTNPGKQRKVVRTIVFRYAEQMRRDRWTDNAGGAVLFDSDGILRGGQHRLIAQQEAGVTLSFVVRWDQTEEEIAADNEGGRPWSAADIAGGTAPHKHVRQAIATALLLIDRDQGLIAGQPTGQPAKLDVAKVCNDPRIIRAAEIGTSIHTTLPDVQGTAIGTMCAMAAHCNAGNGEKAPYFFESLRTGAGLFPGDPVHTLRNMLIGVTMRNIRDKKWQTMYVTTRAWNYEMAGEKVTKMQRYTPGTNGPLRMAGWRPFFPKDVREQVNDALRELGSETMKAMVKR